LPVIGHQSSVISDQSSVIGQSVRQPDESTRRQPPTLYTGFHYYCVKELTIPPTGRKCRCSLGTVANRLKLLQDKINFPSRTSRLAAPDFCCFLHSLCPGFVMKNARHGVRGGWKGVALAEPENAQNASQEFGA
jgi:hypothetical protein